MSSFEQIFLAAVQARGHDIIKVTKVRILLKYNPYFHTPYNNRGQQVHEMLALGNGEDYTVPKGRSLLIQVHI